MAVFILIQPTGGYKSSDPPCSLPFPSEIMFSEGKAVRKVLNAPLWLCNIKKPQSCKYNLPQPIESISLLILD